MSERIFKYTVKYETIIVIKSELCFGLMVEVFVGGWHAEDIKWVFWESIKFILKMGKSKAGLV